MKENTETAKTPKNPVLVTLEAEFAKLKASAKPEEEDQLNLADNYKSMAEIHFRQNNYSVSSKLYTQALVIFARFKNNKGLTTCQNAIASICLAKGELAAAQSKLEGLLQMFQKHPNLDLEHIVLNNMGIVHEKKGDLPKAVLFYHRSLSIKYELDNPTLPTYTLHNLANIYQQVEDYDTALRYNHLALDIIEGGADLNAQATILNSIAHINSMQGLLVEARDHFLQAQQIATKGNNLAQIAQSHAGLGQIEFKRRNYEDAKILLNQALESYRKLEEQEYIVRCLIDLAKINQTLNLNEALAYIQEARRICKVNGFRSLLAEVYDQSAQLKATKEDFKKAYYYQKLYLELYKETHKINILNQVEVNKLSVELKNSKSQSKFLKKQANQLKHESLHDHLTGAGNRRQLDKFLKDNWQQNSNPQKGNKKTNYLAMLDIDDFKNINDSYSHALGDKVLQSISSIIHEYLRDQDEYFRYGGEEFTILLKDSSTTAAQKILNCIRMGIETHDWNKLEKSLKVTATIGMVSSEEQQSIEQALTIADERMYCGKNNGKNKLVFE